MSNKETLNILRDIEKKSISPEEALLKLKMEPFKDLGFAKVDYHRKIRQGEAEVIYGEGKTREQIVDIVHSMVKNGQETILITRTEAAVVEAVSRSYEVNYNSYGKIAVVGKNPATENDGTILIVTGGTSDMTVAEEAAVTAEAFGNKVVRLYDVGVSGIHRLLSNLEKIMSADVIVVIAGMEGALASVVGGLADCPVIAVPTSVGYGTSFNGLAALLSMLNSCSSGVSVVNIDNGFGAAYMANLINKRPRRCHKG